MRPAPCASKRSCTRHSANELLEAILTQVLEALPAQSGEIVLVDDQTGQLHVAARHGSPLSAVPPPQELNLARWILTTGRSLLSNNVSADPLFATDVAPNSVAWPRSLLVVPLRRGREPFGLICLMDRRDGLFSEAHLRLLEAIASKSEAGIENARLYHAMEQSELRYRTLFEGASYHRRQPAGGTVDWLSQARTNRPAGH